LPASERLIDAELLEDILAALLARGICDAVLVILEASSPRGLPGVKCEGHQSFFQSARADVEELDSSGVLAVGARLDDNGSAVLNEFPLFDAWQLGLDYGESFSIA
jgi:hypothetical protein